MVLRFSAQTTRHLIYFKECCLLFTTWLSNNYNFCFLLEELCNYISLIKPSQLTFSECEISSHFTKRRKIRSNPTPLSFLGDLYNTFPPTRGEWGVHAAVPGFTLPSVCHPHAMPAAS